MTDDVANEHIKRFVYAPDATLRIASGAFFIFVSIIFFIIRSEMHEDIWIKLCCLLLGMAIMTVCQMETVLDVAKQNILSKHTWSIAGIQKISLTRSRSYQFSDVVEIQAEGYYSQASSGWTDFFLIFLGGTGSSGGGSISRLFLYLQTGKRVLVDKIGADLWSSLDYDASSMKAETSRRAEQIQKIIGKPIVEKENLFCRFF
jgi:hypothetical protein